MCGYENITDCLHTNQRGVAHRTLRLCGMPPSCMPPPLTQMTSYSPWLYLLFIPSICCPVDVQGALGISSSSLQEKQNVQFCLLWQIFVCVFIIVLNILLCNRVCTYACLPKKLVSCQRTEAVLFYCVYKIFPHKISKILWGEYVFVGFLPINFLIAPNHANAQNHNMFQHYF